MIRTRTIADIDGEPVEIEIEDGLPEQRWRFGGDYWILTQEQFDDIILPVKYADGLQADEEEETKGE